MKNFSEADQTKNANIITEGEHRDLVETGRENIKNNGVTDRVIYCDSTEYHNNALANPVDQTNMREWVLVIISRNGKKKTLTT